MDAIPPKRTAPLRVVVADDDLLVRTDLEEVLSAEQDISVVGLCSRLEELLADVARLLPDVVVTNSRMPPTMTNEGVRAAGEILGTFPTVGVVLLSQFLEPTYLLDLIAEDSGRRGYMLKEEVTTPGRLAPAIRAVADGGSYIDQFVVDFLISGAVADAKSPLGRLTLRDRDVLVEFANGKSNRGIGIALGVSEAVIRQYVSRILMKLGVPEDRKTRERRLGAVIAFLMHQP